VAYSEARRQDRAALRDIKVRVRYAPEKLAPVDDIPNGTVPELLRWAKRSPLRARRLLNREIASPAPRIKLVKTLYARLQYYQWREANTQDAAAKMAE